MNIINFTTYQNKQFIIMYDDEFDIAVLVGANSDYLKRYKDNALSSILDDLIGWSIERINFIDPTFKQSIIEELENRCGFVNEIDKKRFSYLFRKLEGIDQ